MNFVKYKLAFKIPIKPKGCSFYAHCALKFKDADDKRKSTYVSIL
jgi:hypothetical protein